MTLKSKFVFVTVLATVLALTGGVVLEWTWFNRKPIAQTPGPQKAFATMAVPAPDGSAPSPVSTAENQPVNLVVAKASADHQAKSKKQNSGKTASLKPPIQDPDAREALSLVGADPEAEAYWAAAINNPNLPAEERKDLIEDLNEDGLSDPKNPGAADLPLILNRLELIDELAPYAMDRVNADAFQEAQKDLLGMLDGKPVQ